MIKILSRASLQRNFSTSNLNKVGKVNLSGGKNDNKKFEPGAYERSKLRNVLIAAGTGKSRGGFDKWLKEHGASGSIINIKKRREIEELAFTDKNSKSPTAEKPVKASDKKAGLTEEQIQRNLKFRMARAELGSRQSAGTQYGGGVVKTTTFGGGQQTTNGAKISGGKAADLKIKVVQSGFAQNYGKTTGFAQGNQDKKPAGDASLKLPPTPAAGSRPIGL